jgi:hypothetical protein
VAAAAGARFERPTGGGLMLLACSMMPERARESPKAA